MNSFEIQNDRIVVDNNFFDARATLFSGQVFKVKEVGEEKYLLVSGNRPCIVEIGEKVTELICEPCDTAYFVNYFDLQSDYGRVSCADEFAKKAIASAKNLKIMRQDKFETVIDFIMSANNNIKRFSKTLFALSEKYGERGVLLGNEYFSFPSAKTLAMADVADLKSLGMGYRDNYVKKTATMIAEGFDLEGISSLETMCANKKLCELVGIGEKVADCILLFAYQKYDAFPVDTWIEKLYRENYAGVSENRREIRRFFVDKFGENAGIIQQYLFFHKREKG